MTTEMHTIELTPKWWEYVEKAVQKARHSIETMYPYEKEVHDLTVEDCDRTLEKIRNLDMDGNFVEGTFLDREVRAIWQGVTDLAFEKKNEQPDNWKPATQWSHANDELPREHHAVLESLTQMDVDL